MQIVTFAFITLKVKFFFYVAPHFELFLCLGFWVRLQTTKLTYLHIFFPCGNRILVLTILCRDTQQSNAQSLKPYRKVLKYGPRRPR